MENINIHKKYLDMAAQEIWKKILVWWIILSVCLIDIKLISKYVKTVCFIWYRIRVFNRSFFDVHLGNKTSEGAIKPCQMTVHSIQELKNISEWGYFFYINIYILNEKIYNHQVYIYMFLIGGNKYMHIYADCAENVMHQVL